MLYLHCYLALLKDTNMSLTKKGSEDIMNEQIDYAAVIEETQKLLTENVKWRKDYAGYASAILENMQFIKKIRTQFHERGPLKFYLTTSKATDAKRTVRIQLRYLGQIVAEMKCRKDTRTLSTKNSTANEKDTYEYRNKRDFNCEIPLADCAWRSDEASKFRSHFKNRDGKRNTESNKKNEEHRIESLLLSEFGKKSTTEKALPYIQPIKIAKFRFPMPTPISASTQEKVTYSGTKGGGIDILTRTGKVRGTKLCIIELKDENLKNEPASIVMDQAIKYTVFIRELLRSDAGVNWWKLFGFGGPIPDKLTLFAACAIPYTNDADTSFAEKEYDIDGDIIKLHYIYFEEANNAITKIHTSLPNPK